MKHHTMKQLLVGCILAAGLSGTAPAETTADAPDQDAPATTKTVKQLQADFRKLGFGMFLHYNMATYKNTQWVAPPPTPPPGPPSRADGKRNFLAIRGEGVLRAVVLSIKGGGSFKY